MCSFLYGSEWICDILENFTTVKVVYFLPGARPGWPGWKGCPGWKGWPGCPGCNVCPGRIGWKGCPGWLGEGA